MDADEIVTVQEVLRSKHPPAAPLYHECLITDSDPALAHHPVIFDAFNGLAICSVALCTSGAVGSLGMVAYVGDNYVQF